MANFQIENKQGYSIIQIHAERLDSQTTPELRSELVLLAGSNITNIIIDMSACHYCDTMGLSALQIAHRLCGRNGNLVLCNVSEEVNRMLSIQRFTPELVIAFDLEGAEKQMLSLIAQ